MSLLPYILLIAIPIIVRRVRFVWGVTNAHNLENNKDYSMKLFWIILFLMLSLRHDTVGRDLLNYKYIFEHLAGSSWTTGLARSPEIAWSFANKLISTLGGSFRWMIVIISLISTFLFAKAYMKYSDDTALTIMLFINMPCFIMLFSGLRQSIAISMGLWAFEFVRDKKILPFLGVVIVASFFHTSAFMLLFMYPLYHVRLKKEWAIFFVPLLLLIYVFNQQIFTILGYLLSTFTDYNAEIQKTGAYATLLLFIIMAVFSFLIPDEEKVDDDTKGMRNYLLMAVVLQMFSPLHSIAMRMNYYYIAFIPLVIPRVIRHRSMRWAQVAIMARYVMLVFFFVYFMTTAPVDNLLDTFPYRFVWE